MVHDPNPSPKGNAMSEKRATQSQELLSFSFQLRSWYANYKRFLFLLIPFFLLALIVTFKSSLWDSQGHQGFLLANSTYLKWDKTQTGESSHLQVLKGLFKKHPEWAVPYEALIVQKLLALGQAAEAQSLAENVLKRASQQSPAYYAQFAKTTVLIESRSTAKDLEKALKEALTLKEEMLSDDQFWKTQTSSHFGSVLFAFNLLRIAFLSETLKKFDEELLAWKEFKRYAKWNEASIDKEMVKLEERAFHVLAKHFTEGNLSLQDYIKYRETTILSLQKQG
jgi:hypothetical protein